MKVKKGQSTDFHVTVFNFQARPGGPDNDACCLTIIVSSQGTSHYLMQADTTELYFRDGDSATQWTATSLSDHRASTRDTNESKELTAEEEVRNAIWIYQVPLTFKRASPPVEMFCGVATKGFTLSSSMPMMRGSPDRASDLVEHAIIGHGDLVKPFVDSWTTVSRDRRLPVRCTVCFFEVTPTGKADKSLFPTIAQRHAQVYKLADDAGSLVTETSERVTEAIGLRPPPGLGAGAPRIQRAGGLFFGRTASYTDESDVNDDGFVDIMM
jgi:hypothetical protein